MAQVCKEIDRFLGKIKWTEKGTVKETTVCKVLHSRCHAELGRVKKEEAEMIRRSEGIDATVDCSSEQKSQDLSECQVFVSRARKRALSLFSFCGELFMLQMFTEEASLIMHECFMCLLQSTSDDEYLEHFSELIAITGKDLDHPEAKVLLSHCLHTLVILSITF